MGTGSSATWVSGSKDRHQADNNDGAVVSSSDEADQRGPSTRTKIGLLGADGQTQASAMISSEAAPTGNSPPLWTGIPNPSIVLPSTNQPPEVKSNAGPPPMSSAAEPIEPDPAKKSEIATNGTPTVSHTFENEGNEQPSAKAALSEPPVDQSRSAEDHIPPTIVDAQPSQNGVPLEGNGPGRAKRDAQVTAAPVLRLNHDTAPKVPTMRKGQLLADKPPVRRGMLGPGGWFPWMFLCGGGGGSVRFTPEGPAEGNDGGDGDIGQTQLARPQCLKRRRRSERSVQRRACLAAQ